MEFFSLPITRRQILDSSKPKKFADDNFKFDENGRKLSKRVENTVGKGEIARYEQFLLFPQCFQKAGFPGASKGVVVWEWVKSEIRTIFFTSHWPLAPVIVVETVDSSQSGMNPVAMTSVNSRKEID